MRRGGGKERKEGEEERKRWKERGGRGEGGRAGGEEKTEILVWQVTR